MHGNLELENGHDWSLLQGKKIACCDLYLRFSRPLNPSKSSVLTHPHTHRHERARAFKYFGSQNAPEAPEEQLTKALLLSLHAHAAASSPIIRISFRALFVQNHPSKGR